MAERFRCVQLGIESDQFRDPLEMRSDLGIYKISIRVATRNHKCWEKDSVRTTRATIRATEE
jgi:hypothetical protein